MNPRIGKLDDEHKREFENISVRDCESFISIYEGRPTQRVNSICAPRHSIQSFLRPPLCIPISHRQADHKANHPQWTLQARETRANVLKFLGPDITIRMDANLAKFVVTHGMRRLRWIVLAGVCCLAQICAANSLEQSFLDGQRTRRLFALAEQFCREQLARTDLPPILQGDLTVEFSRTLVDHALNAAPEKRGRLWQQPTRSSHSSPQAARNTRVCRWCKLKRQSSSSRKVSSPEKRPSWASPRRPNTTRPEHCCGSRSSDSISCRRRSTSNSARAILTATPLAIDSRQPNCCSCRRNVALHRARALRQQGESYPSGSPDRSPR